jgi:hypothetical protein
MTKMMIIMTRQFKASILLTTNRAHAIRNDRTDWLLAAQLLMILWRIYPLPGNDLETNETIAVAMQRRCKYASSTIELLLGTVFST